MGFFYKMFTMLSPAAQRKKKEDVRRNRGSYSTVSSSRRDSDSPYVSDPALLHYFHYDIHTPNPTPTNNSGQSEHPVNPSSHDIHHDAHHGDVSSSSYSEYDSSSSSYDSGSSGGDSGGGGGGSSD